MENLDNFFFCRIDVREVDITTGENRTPGGFAFFSLKKTLLSEFTLLNPNQHVPVMKDRGEGGRDFVVFESHR